MCDEDDNTSDPYVRIIMKTLDKKIKKKTRVVKDNLNPVYDQR